MGKRTSQASSIHAVLDQVTQCIIERSQKTRATYLTRMERFAAQGIHRSQLSCANQAHISAGATRQTKIWLHEAHTPNIGIVTAYNDMLSAHAPYADYPEAIKLAAIQYGATAQVAGGVPAMCDGITQGQVGMELSLFSRDVIAQASAVALSHRAFDAVICLGICDKIVPGLLIGALSFGYLPTVFIPSGPMSSGLSNTEKGAIREQYAQGLISKEALLAAESRAYHEPGTCTFYGTANSNQMLLEAMGLHLPGAAFVPPFSDLRKALTHYAVKQVLALTHQMGQYIPISHIVNEKAIVNALVVLLATGGSTNHTIHWIAVARAAGIIINWDDFDALSAITPLIVRMYPNGVEDVNAFEKRGGPPWVIRELLSHGLLHEDVSTVSGRSLDAYTKRPVLVEGELSWEALPDVLSDEKVMRPITHPFSRTGGLKLLQGNLGRAIVKLSAVDVAHWKITAPAKVFTSQAALLAAWEAGQLQCDFIAVLMFQGPHANGMPELHQLTPILGSLLSQGFHVALVTDGRMSGASGKVLAALHLYPEAAQGGPLSYVRDGDPIMLDAEAGRLDVLLPEAIWRGRTPQLLTNQEHEAGCGREFFTLQRRWTSSPEEGASTLFLWENQ